MNSVWLFSKEIQGEYSLLLKQVVIKYKAVKLCASRVNQHLLRYYV